MRPTCDKLLELPLVIKHVESLPIVFDEIKDEKKSQNGAKNQLLKTIKLGHDSKDKIDL